MFAPQKLSLPAIGWTACPTATDQEHNATLIGNEGWHPRMTQRDGIIAMGC